MKEVEFTIKAKMNGRWVNDFCAMLKWMQSCGKLGHSSIVGFYADGDGDFRPEFEFDCEYGKTEAKWAVDQKLPALEVLFDAG